jgi:quinol monooxygenase YgiN
LIWVIATIEVADGRRNDFLSEFRRLVPLVHEEAGCIEYGPTLDLPTGLSAQAAMRPNIVTIVEKWESLEHLKAHLAAPHMAEYRNRVTDIVLGVSLQILQPV